MIISKLNAAKLSWICVPYHTAPPSPRLESQGLENITDQVCNLRIDGISVLEHNTACIKAAAIAAHYR